MFGLVRPNTALARTQAPDVQRWDPWSEMERMREEMDDIVTRAFGFTPINKLVERPGNWAAPVELHEEAGQYVLRAHLPGIPREDLNLEVTGNRIHLWCERRAQTPADGAKVLVNTTSYGRISFAYEFPVELRKDEVKATYRDGVLEVILPKVEETRPESLKIAIEG
jgi:HSP20 family protein